MLDHLVHIWVIENTDFAFVHAESVIANLQKVVAVVGQQEMHSQSQVAHARVGVDQNALLTFQVERVR